jgi:predicted transcriptional regulator of viral defense system
VEDAIKQTIGTLRGALERVVSDLSPTEAKVIDALVKTEIDTKRSEISYMDIARLAKISNKSLGSLLGRLAQKGIVRKTSRGKYALSQEAIKEYVTALKEK